MKSGNLNFLEHSGPLRACNGTALPFYLQDRIQLPLLMQHIIEPIRTFAVTNTFPQPQIAVFVLTLFRILRDKRQKRDALFDTNVLL